MSEMIIIPKEDLEKMFLSFLDRMVKSKSIIAERDNDEKFNQVQASKYLGITQSTLIRWKKNGLITCEQLPGSSKITYYKSELKEALRRNPGLLQPVRK